MSGFAADKLQAAVFTALSTNTALLSMVTAVFDEPITGAIMPYVSLGETSHKPWDTKSSEGAETLFTVNIWSNEASQMQAKEIMAQVDSILHQSSLAVSGHLLISLFTSEAAVKRNSTDTGSFYQGILKYRAVSTRTV